MLTCSTYTNSYRTKIYSDSLGVIIIGLFLSAFAMITEDYTESDSLETTVPSFVSTGEAANEVEPSYELLEHRFVNALPEDEALRV